MNTRTKNQLEAARRYAEADKSDPFAFARAKTHIRNGIATFNVNDDDARYDATEATETVHLPEGQQFSNGDTSFERVVYRNRRRP